jgi:TRAP transporter 4TM/12TM fusion protein
MQKEEDISKISPSEWLLSDRKGMFQKIIAFSLSGWCICIWLFHTYCAYFGQPEAMLFRTTHVMLFLVAAFLFYPLKRKGWNGKFNLFFLIDLLLILLVVAIQAYMYIDFDAFQARGGVSATTMDLLLGGIMIFLIFEAARRTVGWPLVIIVGMFFVYSIGAEHFPGILNAPQVSLPFFIDVIFIGPLGIYGIAIYVMSAFVVMFIFFGSFLLESGAGDFFIKLAYALTGKRTGGPAKAAVVSSAFMATISGSIVANVVTTGSFTIPMMKKAGLKPVVAGAIESVASTGGQIMPPVMGAVAFIMAFYLGIPYVTLCYYAAIPAVLYFVSVYCMIHFEAKKTGLQPLDSADIPNLMEILKEGGHNLVPIAVIIYFLVVGYSPTIVGFLAIVSVFLLSFRRKRTAMTYRKAIKAMENGVKACVMVSVACMAVGIIIAAVGQTGFGARITALLTEVSGGSLLTLLILTMVLSIILGMGLTTIVLYVSLSATVVPALLLLGVGSVSAHLFVLYYGVFSNIIPPVAFAAFAGAAVAGSDPMRTGIIAMKFGVAGILLPFLFVYQPALVLAGNWVSIVLATITSIIAIVSLAAALQGWFLARINLLKRTVLGSIFVILVVPNWQFKILGLALFTFYLFVLDRESLFLKLKKNYSAVV